MHPVLALPLWANMSVYKTEALTQWIGWVLFSESRVLYHYITIGGSYKFTFANWYHVGYIIWSPFISTECLFSFPHLWWNHVKSPHCSLLRYPFFGWFHPSSLWGTDRYNVKNPTINTMPKSSPFWCNHPQSWSWQAFPLQHQVALSTCTSNSLWLTSLTISVAEFRLTQIVVAELRLLKGKILYKYCIILYLWMEFLMWKSSTYKW